jgi:hypothetical protein
VRENVISYYSLAIHVWNFPLSSLTRHNHYFIFDRIVSCNLLLLYQKLLYLASILPEIMSNHWREWRNKNETKNENRTAAFAIINKCTLVQALRLCTGRTAHRGSRVIALLFHDQGTRRGWRTASRPGHSLPRGKTRYPLYRKLGGPQASLDRCRKSRQHRDLIPGPSSP